MIPLYVPARHRFIKDIASPTIGDAIKKSAKQKKTSIPVKSGYASLRLNNSGKITRIPPMAEFHYYRPLRQLSPTKRILPVLPWLPKKYIATKGLVTDWHTRTFREVKLAAPILVSSAALMLLALSWQLPEIQDHSDGHPQYAHKASATTPTASNPPATDVSDSKPATEAQPARSSNSLLPPMKSSSSSAPTVSEPPLPVIEPPIDEVIPPVDPGVGGSSGGANPPLDLELPPIDIDLGPLQATTPGVSLEL